MEFPGKQKLVAALDAAVARAGGLDPTIPVAAALCRLQADPAVRLPAAVHTPVAGQYARRELHLSPEHGYSVVAMTWAPGQGAPVHDHGGAWCAEAVWQGRLAVDDYLPVEHQDPYWRFAPAGRTEIGTGGSGRLQPPDEYHAVHNPDPAQVAVSIHVYQRRLLRCHVFVEDPAAPAGWLRREERLLASDAVD